MIEFRIAALAKQKKLTGYAINKKLAEHAAKHPTPDAKRIHPDVGYRLLEADEQESLTKATIERACIALDCEPGDFIVRVPDAEPSAKKTTGAKKSSKK